LYNQNTLTSTIFVDIHYHPWFLGRKWKLIQIEADQLKASSKMSWIQTWEPVYPNCRCLHQWKKLELDTEEQSELFALPAVTLTFTKVSVFYKCNKRMSSSTKLFLFYAKSLHLKMDW